MATSAPSTLPPHPETPLKSHAKKSHKSPYKAYNVRYTRPTPPRSTRSTRTRRRAPSADPRPKYTRARPSQLVYVDNPVDCAAATELLMKHSRLAVDCEGMQLSRTGRLCVVQVASADRIFIFDLVGNGGDAAWGRRFFEEGGLKALLEAESIEKVMHDCRHDSDAFFHQFGVILGPVIDTQVAFSVLRRVKGKVQGLPVSLKTLLKKYSGASEEQLAMKNTVKDAMKGDDDFWMRRPLPPMALQYARLDVEHLLSMTQRMARYIDAADKNGWDMVKKESREYLSVFRDDAHGPRKADLQYEQMARTARRQRVAEEAVRRINAQRQSDPMRKFVFDKTPILTALVA